MRKPMTQRTDWRLISAGAQCQTCLCLDWRHKRSLSLAWKELWVQKWCILCVLSISINANGNKTQTNAAGTMRMWWNEFKIEVIYANGKHSAILRARVRLCNCSPIRHWDQLHSIVAHSRDSRRACANAQHSCSTDRIMRSSISMWPLCDEDDVRGQRWGMRAVLVVGFGDMARACCE